MVRTKAGSDDIVVFAGSGLGSKNIAEDITKILELRLSKLHTHLFPDREIRVRIPVKDVEGKHVLYVQSTAPKRENIWKAPQSQSLVELFLTLDAFKEKGAKTVDVVVPYLTGARQHKEFKKGESVSTRTIAKILRNLGIFRLFTVDVHSHRRPGFFFLGRTRNFGGVKGYNITAAKALASYIKDNLETRSPVVVIPDKGHVPIADEIREIIVPDEIVFMKKKRLGGENVRFKLLGELDLKGKDVVIFDDMISTGRTLVGASRLARKRGATTVLVAVTHTLYVKRAREQLLGSGVDRIVATDTIPKEDSVVPIAPIIAESLKKILF